MPSGETDSAGAERRVIRLCECGQVGTSIGHGELFYTVRCGRDSRRNMRHTCPTRTVEIEVVRELDLDRSDSDG